MMTNTFRGKLAALAIGVLLTACSSIRVSADYDPAADFSALRTYSWLPEETAELADPRAGNQLVSERVTEAIERELGNLGFEKVDADGDIAVGFTISVRRGVDVVSEPVYFGRWGPNCGGGLGFSESTRVYEYEEGSLLIDFVDAEANALIWRGTGSSRLRDNQTPEESTERINKTVAKVLAQFPPG